MEQTLSGNEHSDIWTMAFFSEMLQLLLIEDGHKKVNPVC